MGFSGRVEFIQIYRSSELAELISLGLGPGMFAALH
ncbi:hypothetical protein HOE425_300068 [Hoeflea sp. EC-HK425]|nr:hypothetical protein HOE425_300068 [Hoeflea sp. EC-HK425]